MIHHFVLTARGVVVFSARVQVRRVAESNEYRQTAQFEVGPAWPFPLGEAPTDFEHVFHSRLCDVVDNMRWAAVGWPMLKVLWLDGLESAWSPEAA